MKKRQFFAAITVMMLALVMVFSFVACNGGNDDDPANIKGEEVTAEQWVKAFDFSDVTNVTTTSVTSGKDDGVDFKSTSLMEYDGDKMHYKRTYEYTDEDGEKQENVYEYYMLKEDNKVYEYEYDEYEKQWNRDEIQYDGNWNIGSFPFANDFAKFTYDKSKKGYVATYDYDGESVAVLIKIKDGKFVYAEQSGKEDGEPMTVTVTISKINSTSITLPTIEENSNN